MSPATQTPAKQTGKTTPPAQPNATRANQVAAEAKAKAEKKAAKTPKEPKVDPMLPKVITVATKDGANPKREGTASHARFALYRKGMTVAQYLDACEAAKQSRRHARADINWDAKHGFITISDA